MPVGRVRGFILRLLGQKCGTAITIGSYIASDGAQCVSITLQDGWTNAAARLTPAGARLIAQNLTDWADWADKGNAANAQSEFVMRWRYFTNKVMKDGQWQAVVPDVAVAAKTDDQALNTDKGQTGRN